MKYKGRVLIISSVVAMVVTHVLFKIYPRNDFFVAEWTAGEILTYLGTIVLGWLAIWQNEELKKANDDAQERLEKISLEANRISVVSKIIEYEFSKKKELEESIKEFENATNVQIILKAHADEASSNGQLMKAESAITESFLRLCLAMKIDYSSNEYEFASYQASIIRTYQNALLMTDCLKMDDAEQAKNIMEKMNEERINMDRLKRVYIGEKGDKLDNLIYNNADLSEIEKIF